MDFYRLEGDDLASIDLNDYLAEEGVVIIERPQVIQADLPSNFLELVLSRVDDSWDSTKRLQTRPSPEPKRCLGRKRLPPLPGKAVKQKQKQK